MSSQSDPSTGIIVKSDRSGRTRYTTEYKQEVVAAYESSSVSAPDFAKQCGIKYPTFAAWIAARKHGDPKSAGVNVPAFLLAELASTSDGAALEVRLPGGAVARASDVEQIRLLAALIRQLA